jgi:hypothetical protein
MVHFSIRLSAVSTHQRHAVVAALTTALNELGWILDHHQFSNLAISVMFEIPRGSVPEFRRVFMALPLRLSEGSQETIAALESAPPSTLPDPIAGSVHILFIHSEPDLRVPVPAVPG